MFYFDYITVNYFYIIQNKYVNPDDCGYTLLTLINTNVICSLN